MNWDAPPKPAEWAEKQLIAAILDGHFAIGDKLPAERELAKQLGVTRPTLRETLQRLARDGWLEIRQGRSTRVRNYWQEGSLGVLDTMVHYPNHLPADFVPNLLQIRQLMAPTYTRLAVERNAAGVSDLLDGSTRLGDQAEAYAHFDWQLHHQLTILSGNPIFTLILNGFAELYQKMALFYFSRPEARRHSGRFYNELAGAAQAEDGRQAAQISSQTMLDSMAIWQELSGLEALGGE